MNELGWIVLGASIRATALAVVGLVAVVGLKRRGPSATALAGSSTMLVMIGVTALALSPWPRWWSPGWGERIPGATTSASADAKTTEPARPGVDPVPRPRLAASPSPFWSDFAQEFSRELANPTATGRSIHWRWPAWVACLFLAGLAFALIRLGLGLWAVRSLRSRSQVIHDPALLDVLTKLRGELGVHQPIELRESSELATPATVGWRRPAVLLPNGWAEWDEPERLAVLAHELAHIRRGDYAAGLAVQISLALHFYHPLVHALARRLRLQQELAADALGASLAGGRRPYLTALANLALRQDPRPAAWPARSFLPTPGTFLRRIEMLRDPKALQHPPLRRTSRALTVATLAVIGLLIAGFRGPNGSSQAQDPAPGKAAFILAGEIVTTDLPPLDPTTASSDVHVVIDFRPADLLKNPEFKKLVGQIPPDRTKEMSAILAGEIEQILILGFDRNPNAIPMNSVIPPQLAMIFRSAKPMDWKTFISPKVEEAKADGISYLRTPGAPGGPCYRILDDRTLLMGIEADVLAPPIGTDRPKGRHDWDLAWKKLALGPIRLGFDTAWLARLLEPALGQGGPGALLTGAFAPLLEKTQAYALALGVPDGLTLDAFATCSTEADSRRVAETLRACLALGRNALPDLRKMAEGGPPPMARTMSDLLDAVDAMLDTAKVDQDTTIARLHAQADASAVAMAARMLLPAMGAQREAARRSVCINHLKQIMLAMHNYHSANDCFPPAVLYGPDGKTPYSWRVALLPFLEQQDLYNQYKFDEPWDGPNNRKLIERMPAVFNCPDDEQGLANHFSSYFAPVGPDTIFPDRKKGMGLEEILDGTSNTIMVVEARRLIPWTQPEDIPMVGGLPDRPVGQLHPGGADYGFTDGAVRFLKDSINLNVLRALFTRAGGEVISNDAY